MEASQRECLIRLTRRIPMQEMRKDKMASGTTPTGNLSSIRGQILRRVLPVVLLPLLGLGIIAIVGIALVQERTTGAVEDAETIITNQVVVDGANRSAETGTRQVANYLDSVVRRSRLATEDTFLRETIANVAITGETDVARIRLLANSLQRDLITSENDLQVLIVNGDGLRMGHQSGETKLDYSADAWFIEANADGLAWRSYVDDGEFLPSFEIAYRVRPSLASEGSGVVRIRIPIASVQRILDQVAQDNAVDAAMIDTSASLILADTATEHDPSIVFDTATMMTPDSGVNLELLQPGTLQGEDSISSARQVSDLMDNELEIAFDWLVQTNRSADVAADSLAGIRQVSDDVVAQRQFVTFGLLGLMVIAFAFAFIAVRAVANRITEPVKALSDQAQDAASDGIPAVVEAARTSEQLPELPDFSVDTNDELAVLAHSLNTMQDAAVNLAAGQAKLRRQNVARTFVSLGRRNQNLLNRQLEFIEELEEQETDADVLENLFRLDHLATRMRRNAENLLVLAGEQTPRRWGRPIAVRDVLRAAASEIADYRRVKLGDIDAATVPGSLATDLSHLIAELLENAGSFSPPNTPIEVLGQHTTTHYRLAIVDHGIGMDAAALEELNGRLKNPVDFADAPSAYLGLFVVGRLAQDIGITVRLASADPTGEGRRRGTIAFVDLPVAMLTTEAATPISIDERNAEAMAKRAQEATAADPATAADSVAPAAEVAPAAPTPPAAPIAEPAVPVGTTSAGFPQRRRRGSEDATADTPAAPEPAEAVAPAPAPVARSTETTSAGFPKRRGSKTDAGADATPPAPPQQESGAPIAVPQRDAKAVSSSLSSIRAAVARGRASGQAEADGVGAPEAPTAASEGEVQPTAPAAAPAEMVTPPVPDAALPNPPVDVAPAVPTAMPPIPDAALPNPPVEVAPAAPAPMPTPPIPDAVLPNPPVEVAPAPLPPAEPAAPVASAVPEAAPLPAPPGLPPIPTTPTEALEGTTAPPMPTPLAMPAPAIENVPTPRSGLPVGAPPLPVSEGNGAHLSSEPRAESPTSSTTTTGSES